MQLRCRALPRGRWCTDGFVENQHPSSAVCLTANCSRTRIANLTVRFAHRMPPLRKTRHRGTALVGWAATLTAAAYNLVRIPKLPAAAA
jgi:hypothetical protein